MLVMFNTIWSSDINLLFVSERSWVRLMNELLCVLSCYMCPTQKLTIFFLVKKLTIEAEFSDLQNITSLISDTCWLDHTFITNERDILLHK